MALVFVSTVSIASRTWKSSHFPLSLASNPDCAMSVRSTWSLLRSITLILTQLPLPSYPPRISYVSIGVFTLQNLCTVLHSTHVCLFVNVIQMCFKSPVSCWEWNSHVHQIIRFCLWMEYTCVLSKIFLAVDEIHMCSLTCRKDTETLTVLRGIHIGRGQPLKSLIISGRLDRNQRCGHGHYKQEKRYSHGRANNG